MAVTADNKTDEKTLPQGDPFLGGEDVLPDPADGPAHGPGSLEIAAEMDYPEHEETYALFLAITKWGVITTSVLLIAMAIGFFGGGGLFGGIVAFIILMVAARILF